MYCQRENRESLTDFLCMEDQVVLAEEDAGVAVAAAHVEGFPDDRQCLVEPPQPRRQNRKFVFTLNNYTEVEWLKLIVSICSLSLCLSTE